MEKVVKNIKLGKSTWFNQIGLILFFIGIISVFAFLVLWISGDNLPSEMQFLYYGIVIGDSLFYSGGIGLILTFLGFKIANFRIYENAELIFQLGDEIRLISKSKRIELAKWQIGKILVRKKWFSDDYKFRIKTTTNEEYHLRADKNLIDELSDKYEHKMNLRNAV